MIFLSGFMVGLILGGTITLAGYVIAGWVEELDA